MAVEAERVGLRRVGLPIETQSPHGFSNEKSANTDGISRLLKFCHDYWVKDYPKRVARIAALKEELKELEGV